MATVLNSDFYPDSTGIPRLELVVDAGTPATPLVCDLSSEITADQLWTPTYGYDRDSYTQKYKALGRKLLQHGLDKELVLEDLELSLEFINRSYDRFFGMDSVADKESIAFAFIIPTRINSENSRFSEEINPFIPILKHVDPLTRVRTLQGMVPTILDRYMPNSDGKYGAIIFAPAMQQMIEDLGVGKGVKAARKAVEDAAFLAHDRLGAPLVGLGATLPKFTKMGESIRRQGLEVTTGHAATVAVFSEMPSQLEQAGLMSGNRVGLLGQGSIGLSTGDALLADDNNEDRRIVIYDTSAGQLKKSYEYYVERYGAARVIVASGIDELIDKSDVILSAVTTTLTDEQVARIRVPYADDSQPTSINEQQASETGIIYVQPMVEDKSEPRSLQKQDGYNYGGHGAVNSRIEEFTCGGEVAALSISGKLELATHEQVTQQKAKVMRALMDSVGIVPARLQGFGRYVAAAPTIFTK